jgi:hypothetical protein
MTKSSIQITKVTFAHVEGTSDDRLYTVHFTRGEEGCCTTFVLRRSDMGDGGWSLHSEWQIEAARRDNDVADYALSGEGKRNGDEWSHPSNEDFAKAIEAA